VLTTTLAELEPALTEANLTGPALTFLGLAPRAALAAATEPDVIQLLQEAIQ